MLRVPHTEAEYQQTVALLDELIDTMGEDKNHPLASLMETLGILIETYESSHFVEPTGDPIYYYIHRYYGRKNGENERYCPGCGQAWRVKDITEPDDTFWDFTFKCEQCRLVSHLACSTEDDRRAIVGEYKE